MQQSGENSFTEIQGERNEFEAQLCHLPWCYLWSLHPSFQPSRRPAKESSPVSCATRQVPSFPAPRSLSPRRTQARPAPPWPMSVALTASMQSTPVITRSSAQAGGFQTANTHDINVVPSIVTTYDPVLTVGEVSQAVTVEANSNNINTENGQLSSTVSTVGTRKCSHRHFESDRIAADRTRRSNRGSKPWPRRRRRQLLSDRGERSASAQQQLHDGRPGHQ